MTAPTKGTGNPHPHRRANAGSLVRAPRKKLPLGRGAVLVVDGRDHIVGIADMSVTGAYLTTRAPIAKGKVCLLKLAPVIGRVQLGLRVRVVRTALAGEESAHHPRGIAVQFLEIEPDVERVLAAFVGRR